MRNDMAPMTVWQQTYASIHGVPDEDAYAMTFNHFHPSTSMTCNQAIATAPKGCKAHVALALDKCAKAEVRGELYPGTTQSLAYQTIAANLWPYSYSTGDVPGQPITVLTWLKSVVSDIVHLRFKRVLQHFQA